MTHPLQHLFDQADRNAVEDCPSCASPNVMDWRQCVNCGLCREGWRAGGKAYFRERECPECHNMIRSDDLSEAALAQAGCDSEWCDMAREDPSLRRHKT